MTRDSWVQVKGIVQEALERRPAALLPFTEQDRHVRESRIVLHTPPSHAQ